MIVSKFTALKPKVCINHWMILSDNKLAGQITNHPEHEDGAWIRTTNIVSYDSEGNWVETKNTIYILGVPA